MDEARGSEEPADPKRQLRFQFYMPDVETDARFRNCYLALRGAKGWSSIADFMLDMCQPALAELEQEFNGGEAFDPPPKRSYGPGQPPRAGLR